MKSEAKLMLSLAAGAALVLACTPQSDGVSRPASSASVLAQKHSAMPSSATSAGSPDTESRDTSESPTTAESPTTEQSPTSAESAESSAASAPQLPVQRPAATTPQPPAASSQKPAGPATATFV